MSGCIERHDLTRNIIVCDREQGHEGMHRDNGQNLYWHPGAPHLESVTLGSAVQDHNEQEQR